MDAGFYVVSANAGSRRGDHHFQKRIRLRPFVNIAWVSPGSPILSRASRHR